MKSFSMIPTIALVISITACFSQTGNSDAEFKDGDRVSFIGNSITANGQFVNFINLYYVTRFPQQKIRFINSGISGNTSAGVIARIEKDILIHKPTWSVVMLGMNDVKRNLYGPASDTIQNIVEKRQKELHQYKERIEFIITTLLRHNSKVIMQKPSIYDQTGVLRAKNSPGINDALGECSEVISELAQKYNLPVVDYWTILKKVNESIQQKDSSKTIIGQDRVHPGIPGHFVMAYEFLKSTISPGDVTIINIRKSENTSDCRNCELKDFSKNRDGYHFSAKLHSMPFPVKVEAKDALNYVPFISEYNQHTLHIPSLKKGTYDLLIDSIHVGKFTAKQLRKGINLALLQQIPQYKQAEKIQSLLEQYLATERILRAMRMVEFDFLGEKAGIPVDSAKVFLNHLLSTKYKDSQYYNYYKGQMEQYIKQKPEESALQQALDDIFIKVYNIKPGFHHFEIIKAG